MKRTLIAMAVAALFACGPSGSSSAIFKLVNAGEGPDLMTHIDQSSSASWVYLVGASFGGTASETHYLDSFQLPEGPRVDRYVTDLQIIFLEQNATGRYYWGSSDGDVLKAPIVELSYPLRMGRTWTTGNENFPNWYQYSVDAVETVETPAGVFKAVRLLQFNSRAGNTVTRWYVDNIGMVQRSAPEGNDFIKTTLLSFTGEAP